jgi:hypothetical protein
MLDQDADEPLAGAEDGPVDHVRRVLGTVLAGIGELEPVRHVHVDLDGAALPLAADRVLQHLKSSLGA